MAGMNDVSTTLLFVATAVAEILGCYLPYLWLRHGKSPWLLIPATTRHRTIAAQLHRLTARRLVFGQTGNEPSFCPASRNVRSASHAKMLKKPCASLYSVLHLAGVAQLVEH